MDKFRVFRSVTLRSFLPVKFGVFKRQIFATVSTLTLLLAPFHSLKLDPDPRFASLIILKLFCYFSSVGEQQERISARQVGQPLSDLRQQFVSTLQLIGGEVSVRQTLTLAPIGQPEPSSRGEGTAKIMSRSFKKKWNLREFQLGL
jgi:hypothetical protein